MMLCALAATAIAIILNAVFSTNILAPTFINSTTCEIRDDLFTTERMNELLPLEEGQNHQQILCKQTNMVATSLYITRLQKNWTDGNAYYSVHIDYHSDDNGTQTVYVSSDPFLYLLMPLVFALFLAKQGQTPGKRILGITVYDANFENPDFKSALKREYLKGIFYVTGSLFGFYTILGFVNIDIDEAAEMLQSKSAELGQSNFQVWIVVGAAVAIAMFWFHFGSFIRWRGRTYWDQFAKLNTGKIKELNIETSVQN